MIMEMSYYLLMWVLMMNFISLLMKKWDDMWFYLMLSMVTMVMMQLFISFMNNDFCLQMMSENSQMEEPFLYKIAALWSNNEGSLLLCYWLLLMLLLNYKYKFDYFMIKMISFVLIMMMNLSMNPLMSEKDFYLEVGSSLNPLLEDPVMMMHPPMMFTGYGLMVLLMMSKYYNLELKYMLLKSFGMMSLGIGLGSWWAYYELGWGGFWFWDPMENLALLPWLMMMGLMHMMYMKDENIESSMFLSCFMLTVLGTVMVSMGLLNSLHSFVKMEKSKVTEYMMYLIMMTMMCLIMMYMSEIMINLKKLNESLMYVMSMLVVMIMMMGTLMMPMMENINKLVMSVMGLDSMKEYSFLMGKEYYNELMMPMMGGLLMVLMSKKLEEMDMFMMSNLMVMNLLMDMSWNGKMFSMMGMKIMLDSMKEMMSKGKEMNGKKMMGHVGLGLVVLGVTYSELLEEVKMVNMKMGESVKMGEEMEMSLCDYEMLVGKNADNFVLKYVMEDSYMYYPEKSMYNTGMEMTSSKVGNNMSGDVYVTYLGGNFQDGFLTRINVKPGMGCLWLGVFFFFLFFLI